jgi:hypothetical protein
MMRALLVALLALPAGPVLGDAVTYSGTVGKVDIVVEFSSPAATATLPFAGRYFYRSNGVDIPLDARAVGSGKLVLDEEKPCSQLNCKLNADGTVKKVHLGARWELMASPNGRSLSGTWSDEGRQQPLSLVYIGTSVSPKNGDIGPAALEDTTSDLYLTEPATEITKANAPYDYLRLQTKLEATEPINVNGSSYRYVTDPRTRFRFPRIVALADGRDVGPANTFLQNSQARQSLQAFDCMAKQYVGFGWNEDLLNTGGTLGGYQDQRVEVTYLSPEIFSWTEIGTFHCGGAHPWPYRRFTNLDVKAGTELDLSRLFKGWTAKTFDGKVADLADARTHPRDFTWGPDEALAAVVKSHLGDPGVHLKDYCHDEVLIDQFLQVGFEGADRVQFYIGGDLPAVIHRCADILYEAPIAVLNDYLTPEALGYFPSLDK